MTQSIEKVRHLYYRVRKATGVVRRRLSITNSHLTVLTPDVESNKSDPFIDPEARKRYKEEPRYVPTDWDATLPYGGKVYLQRKKKPQAWYYTGIQVFLVVGAFALVYYCWYYTEALHFHATKIYAALGNREAQTIIGHKLLHGQGVEMNHTEAMLWLHEAAKQGDPHASYNVAIGHLQGIKTNLQPGDAKKFIQMAADSGLEEAMIVWDSVCSKGRCDT